MHRARNRKNQVAYNEARRHFKTLRSAKIGAWRKKWKAFWDPLSSSSDPRAVWHFLRKLFGEPRSGRLCSVEEICDHFDNVREPRVDSDFCIEQLRESEEWLLANACSNNSDDRHQSFLQELRFSASEVTSGYEYLKNCALGLDGISIAIVEPILIIIAPAIASFFTALLNFSMSPSDWQIAVLCLINKKSSDRSKLNNFRAVHFLYVVHIMHSSAYFAVRFREFSPTAAWFYF